MNINTKNIVLAICLILGGFVAGFTTSYTPVSGDIAEIVNIGDNKPSTVDFSLFWEVWNNVSDKYVDKEDIDYQKMMYGAISGMVDAIGDPYTSFFTPVENEKFQEDISGSFSGIGVEIAKRDDLITVVSPLKNSPAEKSGLRPGNIITHVNDTSTSGLLIEDVVSMIRGRKGTQVKLTVLSSVEASDSKEITITRDTIKIPTVEWNLLNENDKSIAYIQIYTFNQNVESQFEKAANEILNSKADSIILDLRGNPGGLLDSAINITEWFLNKDDVITHERLRDGSNQTFKATRNGLLRNYPIAVLINEGSASASEILAGALSDSRNATLIGKKTFGKGSVQQLEELSDGSAIKVTIAKWFTPNNVSISEKGIEPRFEIEIPDELVESDGFEMGTSGKDPQLDYAIDFISK